MSDTRCFREWPDPNSVRVHICICIGTGEHECYCGVCGPTVTPPLATTRRETEPETDQPKEGDHA